MDSPDWQRRLPVFRGWPELVAFVVENAPEGLLAVVVVGEGEPPHLNMHAEPYISSTEVGQLLDGTIVRVLGRASVNGRPSGYVYVRDIASGMEGWVSRSGLWTLARHPQAYFPSNGLPILYDVNTLGQTIGLPRLRLTNFNLREAPDHDAHILRDAVNYHSFYATAGRSADSEWIKVVVLITGEVGWVAASIIEPGTLDIESLPVVE
jgi:hypothetical protein